MNRETSITFRFETWNNTFKTTMRDYFGVCIPEYSMSNGKQFQVMSKVVKHIHQMHQKSESVIKIVNPCDGIHSGSVTD